MLRYLRKSSHPCEGTRSDRGEAVRGRARTALDHGQPQNDGDATITLQDRDGSDYFRTWKRLSGLLESHLGKSLLPPLSSFMH